MKQLTRRFAQLSLAAMALLALSGYSSCDPIITNNGFDLWCGDQLCDWDMEAGSIRRVPTWHEADRGIELAPGKVAFSQYSDISAHNSRCIRFDIVANIEGAAELTLEADYFDDGTVDFERSIPGTDWEPSSYLIALPPNYAGIRFRIDKDGVDTAVIAQLQAEESEDCRDLPDELVRAPLGAPCGSDEECVSGYCSDSFFGVCSECDPGAQPTGEHYCETCTTVVPEAAALSPYDACGE